MTATLAALPTAARLAVTARLEDLLVRRVSVFRESTDTDGTGDSADRAGNVEAIIRLEQLDAHIRSLQDQLSAPDTVPAAGDTVQIGSLVTIRFGEGEPTEQFLVGLLEQAGAQLDVITPSSPLGKALLGSWAGDEISYRSASGAALSATLVSLN